MVAPCKISGSWSPTHRSACWGGNSRYKAFLAFIKTVFISVFNLVFSLWDRSYSIASVASDLKQCSCRDRLQWWNYRHAHWLAHVCHYSQLLCIVSKHHHASLGVWPAQHCSVMIQLWAVSQPNWLCLSVLSKKYVHVWTWQYYFLAWSRVRSDNIWSTFSIVLRFKQKLNEGRSSSFVGPYPQNIRNRFGNLYIVPAVDR